MVHQGAGEGDDVGKRGQIAGAADFLELVQVVEQAGDCDQVVRLAALEQGDHGRENGLVGVAIEILGREGIDHLEQRLVLQQDGAKHRLFRLDVLGREHACGGLEILGSVGLHGSQVGSGCGVVN